MYYHKYSMRVFLMVIIWISQYDTTSGSESLENCSYSRANHTVILFT
jgi:hypothetical protein